MAGASKPAEGLGVTDNATGRGNMGTILSSRVLDLDLDVRLRLQAVGTPAGAALELRMLRASPADQSAMRWRETGETVRLPLTALRRFREELEIVTQAAAAFDLWRPAAMEGR